MSQGFLESPACVKEGTLEVRVPSSKVIMQMRNEAGREEESEWVRGQTLEDLAPQNILDVLCGPHCSEPM